MASCRFLDGAVATASFRLSTASIVRAEARLRLYARCYQFRYALPHGINVVVEGRQGTVHIPNHSTGSSITDPFREFFDCRSQGVLVVAKSFQHFCSGTKLFHKGRSDLEGVPLR